MKKITVIVTAILMSAMLFGCTSNEATTTTETERVDLTKLIPDPKDIFTTGKVNTDISSERVFYSITGYNDGEWKAYVEASKEMGFDNIEYETEVDFCKAFVTYNQDKSYWLEVYQANENQMIMITVEVEKEK